MQFVVTELMVSAYDNLCSTSKATEVGCAPFCFWKYLSRHNNLALKAFDSFALSPSHVHHTRGVTQGVQCFLCNCRIALGWRLMSNYSVVTRAALHHTLTISRFVAMVASYKGGALKDYSIHLCSEIQTEVVRKAVNAIA